MQITSIMPDDCRHRVLFRHVGQFIANWSHVEWHLMLLMSGLLKADINRARIVLAASMNFRAKRELILRLGRGYLPDHYLDPFSKMMQRLKHLSEKRNLVAHRRITHLGRGTFRFFNDEDATQPNTFGHYKDIQTATIRAWTKELHILLSEIYAMYLVTLDQPLLEQPRAVPEQSEGHDLSDDPRPNGGATH